MLVDGRPLPLGSPPLVPEMALLPFLRPLVAAARRHSGISPPLALIRLPFLRYMRLCTRNLSPFVKMMQKKKKKQELYILWRHQRGVIHMFTLPPESDFSFCKVAAVPRVSDHRLRSLIGPEEAFVKKKNAMQMRACARMAAPSSPLAPSKPNIGLCHESAGLRHSPGYNLCFF